MIRTNKHLSNSIVKFVKNLLMSQSIVINAKHQSCAIVAIFNGKKIENKSVLHATRILKSLKI